MTYLAFGHVRISSGNYKADAQRLTMESQHMQTSNDRCILYGSALLESCPAAASMSSRTLYVMWMCSMCRVHIFFTRDTCYSRVHLQISEAPHLRSSMFSPNYGFNIHRTLNLASESMAHGK